MMLPCLFTFKPSTCWTRSGQESWLMEWLGSSSSPFTQPLSCLPFLPNLTNSPFPSWLPQAPELDHVTSSRFCTHPPQEMYFVQCSVRKALMASCGSCYHPAFSSDDMSLFFSERNQFLMVYMKFVLQKTSHYTIYTPPICQKQKTKNTLYVKTLPTPDLQ